MGKSIGLEQLGNKVYRIIEGLPPEVTDSLGELEDAFDAIIYGKSGNGKTNFTIILLKALIKALDCRAEYVSYEEGHGKTMRDAMIYRHNMLEEVGNKLTLTDHLTFDELKRKMGRKQSAKIWVIDSLQASHLSFEQCEQLKRLYVLSRKKKVIIYVSWADGKNPQGAVAKAVEYYSQIKMHVDRLVMFPKSRFGGNKPFITWKEGARNHRTTKEWRALMQAINKKSSKNIINELQQKEYDKGTGHCSPHLDKESAIETEDGSGQKAEADVLLRGLRNLAPEQYEPEGILQTETAKEGQVVEDLRGIEKWKIEV